MAQPATPAPAKAPPAPATQADLKAAFAQRAEILADYPLDEDAMKKQDALIRGLVLRYTHEEEADAENKPVIKQLMRMASARDWQAARMLLEDRGFVKLLKKTEANGLIDEMVVINGIKLDIPRGVKVEVPESVEHIFEASDVE
jgi:hypothetical protein